MHESPRGAGRRRLRAAAPAALALLLAAGVSLGLDETVVVEAGSFASRSGGSTALFLSGLAVTLGNPKIMVFYLALLPTIIDIEGIAGADWLSLAIVALMVLVVVVVTYIALATRVRTLLRSPIALRFTNRLSTAVKGGGAAAIAAR